MTPSERPKSEPPTADRRRALREEAFVIATVTCPSGKVRLGAVDNASAEGVALLLSTSVEVGDHLKLAIEIAEGEELHVEGDIVRRMDSPRDGPWLCRVGVRIDPPSEELREGALRIRDRQQAVWRGRRTPPPPKPDAT